WEAEWNVPEKAKLGHYIIDCRVSGKDYEGSTRISIEEYRVPLFSVVVEAKPEVGQTAHAHVSSAYFHGAPNAGARVHWKANWTVTAEFSSDGENNEYKKRYNAFAEIGSRLDPQSEETKTIEGVAVHVDLFHVTTKVAKEQLAPFVYRYRNTDQFAKVASQEVKTPAAFVFPAMETGRYVVAASAPAAKTPLVSDETTVSGEQPAELAVQNETSF